MFFYRQSLPRLTVALSCRSRYRCPWAACWSFSSFLRGYRWDDRRVLPFLLWRWLPWCRSAHPLPRFCRRSKGQCHSSLMLQWVHKSFGVKYMCGRCRILLQAAFRGLHGLRSSPSNNRSNIFPNWWQSWESWCSSSPCIHRSTILPNWWRSWESWCSSSPSSHRICKSFYINDLCVKQ